MQIIAFDVKYYYFCTQIVATKTLQDFWKVITDKLNLGVHLTTRVGHKNLPSIVKTLMFNATDVLESMYVCRVKE